MYRPLIFKRNAGAQWFLLGFVLIAATSRAPVTSLGPLLVHIGADYQLNSWQTGMLTALPLIAFALVSPLAAICALKLRQELIVFLALLIVAVGIGIRLIGSTTWLYVGTCLIGIGIAFLNVLMPSLLKHRYPSQIASLTTLYVLCTTFSAALFSAVAIPLTLSLDGKWATALLALAILPLVTAVVWAPQLIGQTRTTSVKSFTTKKLPNIWHSGLAWKVTSYFAMTSFLYYVAVAWFPTILVDGGFNSKEAGYFHGLMQLAGAVPVLLLMTRFSQMEGQRVLACLAPLLASIGLIGLQWMPAWAALWILLFGIGMSTALVLALTFTATRCTTPQQAASLSAMAQSVGYLFAACGPSLIGEVHTLLGGWGAVISGCVCLCFGMGILGHYVGRPIHISINQSERTV